MAKTVILKSLDENKQEGYILPITRGELVLDSSGNQAFHSNEFLATESQPGLTKINYVEVSTSNISNTANESVKVIQVKSSSDKVYHVTSADAVLVKRNDRVVTLSETLDDIKIEEYLPLSGGTMTGVVNSQNIIPTATNTYNLGSSSLKWANVYATTLTGNLIGNASTATALTSNAGSSTNPVYFTGGKPSACTYSLRASVNAGTTGKLAYYSGTNTIDDLTVSATTDSLYITGVNSSNKLCSGTQSTSGVRIIGGTQIYAGGGFFESSDERLKNFYSDIKVDLDKLAQLPKKYFTWKDGDNENLQIGTSAQAIQEIYPELVNEDENGTLSVAYDKLSVVALAAIDKIYTEIKTLRNQNSELEDRINKLEKLLLNGNKH